jgi:pimeloyl-ACP methyl ester carboxylesterase
MFEPRRSTLDLPDRGGFVALLEFGPDDRPIDVIFSHANGFNALTYRSILAPLAERLRIVAYDLRGHGRTELPTTREARTDWSDLRDDLLAILAALDLKRPVVLAGHSFGGTFSMMAAERARQSVRALVLLDPVLPRTDADKPVPGSPIVEATLRRRTRFANKAAAIENWRGKGAFANWSEEMLADFAEDGLRPDGGEFVLACAPEWEASSYTAQGQDGLSMLLKVAHPTIALKAEHRSTCRIEADDPRIAANPNLILTEVEGTSHFLPMERPDLVREALTAAAEI